MIYARKGLYGMLWQIRKGNNEELVIALEYARAKHGADLSGTVYARESALEGVESDASLPSGYWLFGLGDLVTTGLPKK